jgi:hypothetical protein
MATIPKSAIAAKRMTNDAPPMQTFFLEAAGQTYKIGKSVYLNGSGYVADFTAGIDSGSQRLLGFAAVPGNNLTSAGVQNAANTGTYQSQIGQGLTGVYIGTQTIFEGNISSNGSDVVSLLTHIGQLYPLYQDSSLGFSMIDVADTGSKINCVNTLKPSGQNGDLMYVGDTNQRFEFTLTPASLQVMGTN